VISETDWYKLRPLIYERDNGICGFCGEKVDPGNYHVDHITPRAFGGTDAPDNLRTAHPGCNLSAGAALALGFRGRSYRQKASDGGHHVRLRVPAETYEQIASIARRENRSVPNTIEWLLMTHPRVAPLLPKDDEPHD
jgi:5-methylcytosine-specific restriction endonuclease McrA